jgi:hypothetical protein
MANKNKIEKRKPEGIGRRDFICKSAMACCLANIPFAARSLSKEEKEKLKGSNVNPTELVAYCLLYCGACDYYQNRIGRSAKELKEVLDARKINTWLPKKPGFEDYESFYKVLNNLITDKIGQCPGCRDEGGPNSKIKKCAQEKGYQTCLECPSLPCEKIDELANYFPFLKENIQEVKKIGIEKWAKIQQEKVEKGLTFSDMLMQKAQAGKK